MRPGLKIASRIFIAGCIGALIERNRREGIPIRLNRAI
jgi:hypothetical protein